MCDLIRRQDAIDAHYEYCNKHPDAGFPVWSLKILEDLPSAQPEKRTHERTETHACDLIDRQAAIDAVISLCDNCNPGNCGACLVNFPGMRDCKKVLEELPSAQPDMSEYSDKLWKAAYERGKAEAQPDLDEVYAHAETEAEARFHAEIVRCKDCKHWLPHTQFGYDEDNDVYYDYCAKLIPEDEYYAFQREANDYCSMAERRTDEAD